MDGLKDSQAPVGVITVRIRGNVRLKIPARKVSYYSNSQRFASSLTKSVVDADSPCHTLLSLNGWEDFGRILESYRTLTEGIGDGEKIDESGTKSVSHVLFE